MQIETITFVYNEEFLLPFYLKHYNFVDKFNFFYDCDSTDRTLKILKSDPKSNIIHFKFPDLYDDKLRTDVINSFYKEVDCDAVLNVDVDEFIFCNKTTLEKHLKNHNTIQVKFANVFRHVTEKDLNPKNPILSQRKHGVFDINYLKPIITKTKLDLTWSLGNHNLKKGAATDCGILGAHWANADLCFCIERRTQNRKSRQSQLNIEKKRSFQNHNCTKSSITYECMLHSQDPFIFKDLIKLL